MPKYLTIANYTEEGVKRLLEGGRVGAQRGRRGRCKNLGGSLEGFYFAFGEDDLSIIIDTPDNVSAATASKTADYQPPGA